MAFKVSTSLTHSDGVRCTMLPWMESLPFSKLFWSNVQLLIQKPRNKIHTLEFRSLWLLYRFHSFSRTILPRSSCWKKAPIGPRAWFHQRTLPVWQIIRKDFACWDQPLTLENFLTGTLVDQWFKDCAQMSPGKKNNYVHWWRGFTTWFTYFIADRISISSQLLFHGIGILILVMAMSKLGILCRLCPP